MAIFVEMLRQPQLFLAAARRAREKSKPVVLMHPGRSVRAREAAQSHTGALAGDYALMRALVALGAIGNRTAEQSAAEAAITAAAGIITMAAPWFVTLFAIVNPARRTWIKQLRAETDEAV